MMNINEFSAKVNEYRNMKALLEETQEIVDSLKGEIISYMVEYGSDEIFTEDAKVTYTSSSRRSFDSKALAAALGVDNLDSFKKTSTYKVLRIS